MIINYMKSIDKTTSWSMDDGTDIIVNYSQSKVKPCKYELVDHFLRCFNLTALS